MVHAMNTAHRHRRAIHRQNEILYHYSSISTLLPGKKERYNQLRNNP